jgi:two-component system chemotaxis response regulator CheB
VAQQFGRNAMGIQLSGCGKDGVKGMRAIKDAGGLVIAENPEGITAPYMPQAVINAGLADEILQLQDIPHAINQFIIKRSMRTLPPPKRRLTN